MASSKVWAMAGAGPGTGKKSVRWYADAKAATGKEKPVIAYVGSAHGDGTAMTKMFSTLMFGLTARVVPVKLTSKKLETSEAKRLLAEADLVFVSGGDVDEGMKPIHDRALAPYFRELAEQGKPFTSVSAGSIMLGTRWIRFDEKDEDHVEPIECLGVVPHAFDAHGEGDDWDELQALARMLAGSPGAPKAVVGITSHTCAFWDGKKLAALGGGLARYSVAKTPKRLEDLEPA